MIKRAEERTLAVLSMKGDISEGMQEASRFGWVSSLLITRQLITRGWRLVNS